MRYLVLKSDRAPVLALLLLTLLAYWPGLSGPFVFDDYANLLEGAFRELHHASWDSLPQIAFASGSGPLRRPLSMGSFGINFLLTGLDPFWFKLTNLVIHLVNGLLVWRVARHLLRLAGQPEEAQRWLALALTGLWLLHPLQLTAVLYVVQRMSSLSGTFVLMGILVYLQARSSMLVGRDARLRLWLAVPACLLLSVFAKENGVLLFPLLLAIEVSLLRFRSSFTPRLGNLNQFYGLLLVLPMLCVAAYLLRHPEWLNHGDSVRAFTPLERVLTELRVLFYYLRLLLLPDLGQYGLFYDDFQISRSLLNPISTLFALVGWLGLLTAALAGRQRWPWFTFAVCWYLAAHALESTVVMLELVHLHRNYLACLGPMLALLVGLDRALAPTRPRLARSLVVALVLALAAGTALRADQWRDPLNLARFELRHRPDSPRANYEMGRVLAEFAAKMGDPAVATAAGVHLRRAAELAPREVGALVGLALVAHGPMTADDYALLIKRLRARPMNALDLGYLRALANCKEASGCRLPPSQVLGAFDAALTHPDLAADNKAALLSALGVYLANALGDAHASVASLRDAVALSPQNPELRLNLAQAMLYLPDYDAAEAELAVAEKLDRWQVNAPTLARVRADLAAMRAAHAAAAPAATAQ